MCFLPNFTRRAIVLALPSPVLVRIKVRSNSASPPRIVSISLPCGVVVSAQVSASERKHAPALATASNVLRMKRYFCGRNAPCPLNDQGNPLKSQQMRPPSERTRNPRLALKSLTLSAQREVKEKSKSRTTGPKYVPSAINFSSLQDAKKD